MNGILIIDKPAVITSHDIVAKVRRILRTKRVGHTGTLDPFATGVVVILVGQATRLAQFLDKDEKEYVATIRFGIETDTGDVTGMRSAECGMRNEEIAELLNSIDWENTLNTFRGEIKQVPPMFSAKKVDGKKLYEHARRGETIERKAVSVTVRELEIPDSALSIPQSTLTLRVVCSAGTYIRTLAEDIGRKVGTLAHLTKLRRTRAGKFTIEQSLTIDELERVEEPHSKLISMTDSVLHLPKMVLPYDRVEKTRNGLSTRITETEFNDAEAVQMQDANGNLIAIGFYNEAENIVQPKVVLV